MLSTWPYQLRIRKKADKKLYKAKNSRIDIIETINRNYLNNFIAIHNQMTNI